MRLLNQTVAEVRVGISQKRDCPKSYFDAIGAVGPVADEM